MTRLLIVLLLAGSAWPARAASADQLIKELQPYIGAYPPDFGTKTKQDVEKQYDAAKKQLDAAVATAPGKLEPLFQRGRLQSMGYNMDKAGALKGAEDDFLTVLEKKPRHEGALVELGSLYVNSDPAMLPIAGGLFRSAQTAHGKEPLEGAQRGLYFTCHQQGKMKEALAQAELLTRTWPNIPLYATFVELTRGMISRGESPRAIRVKP